MTYPPKHVRANEIPWSRTLGKSILLLTVVFVIALMFFGCSTTQQVQETGASAPETTTINEKAGPVFNQEKEILSGLSKLGILVPDSVVVVQDTVTHGYVRRIAAPQTVHLTTHRAKYPDAKIPRQYPYLFARTKMPSKDIFRKWVIAHELAHIQGPRLKAEMGRPALGVALSTEEVQADILALALMKAVYGTTWKDLGYPAEIDYPHIPNKSVPALQRKHCYIVKKTWDVKEMDCYTPSSAK